MAIIEKRDNDEEFIFTCPICGTIFTEISRNIYKYSSTFEVDCPNCKRAYEYYKLESYHERKQINK